jgi:hypothetical protein
MASLHNEFTASLDQQVKKLVKLFRGKNVEPNLEELQSSHYEHTQSSLSSWGSPPWNKVPKVDIHKFDGSNPTGWVSKMEQYFSLHDIRDDETKLHVGVFVLGSRTVEVVKVA